LLSAFGQLVPDGTSKDPIKFSIRPVGSSCDPVSTYRGTEEEADWT